jgi:hypothetical protein
MEQTQIRKVVQILLVQNKQCGADEVFAVASDGTLWHSPVVHNLDKTIDVGEWRQMRDLPAAVSIS